MTPEQRYWWRIALELKLRKSSGDAFQDFFSTVMARAHGSDFVRLRAFGVLGDKGCDGYLQSLGHVYQCYGALNGDSGKVAYLIGKMADDFAKALAGVPAIMKEWHMVHNLVEGLPIEAVLKLKELEVANAGRGFGFIGMEGFEERIFALELGKIEDLLGVVATSQDAQNMQTGELRDLVANVANAADAAPFDVTAIRPVPPDKLDFNKLPNHWRSLIANGWQNAHHVSQYLARHHDPLIGERIAQALRVRYQYLKAQNLSPSAIMAALYEMVTGIGLVTPARQVAAQALLAFLFESCDIFEDDLREGAVMILPGKHLQQDRALLGVGAEILGHLDGERTISELWEHVHAARGPVATPLSFDWFVLGLTFLYAIAAVDLADGVITARSRP